MYLFGALVQNSLVSLHVKTIWFDTCCLHILGSSLRLFHQVAVHSLVDASCSGELTAWQAKLRTRTFFLTLVPQIVSCSYHYTVLPHQVLNVCKVPCKCHRVPSRLLSCHGFQSVTALVTVNQTDSVISLPQCITPRTEEVVKKDHPDPCSRMTGSVRYHLVKYDVPKQCGRERLIKYGVIRWLGQGQEATTGLEAGRTSQLARSKCPIVPGHCNKVSQWDGTQLILKCSVF